LARGDRSRQGQERTAEERERDRLERARRRALREGHEPDEPPATPAPMPAPWDQAAEATPEPDAEPVAPLEGAAPVERAAPLEGDPPLEADPRFEDDPPFEGDPPLENATPPEAVSPPEVGAVPDAVPSPEQASDATAAPVIDPDPADPYALADEHLVLDRGPGDPFAPVGEPPLDDGSIAPPQGDPLHEPAAAADPLHEGAASLDPLREPAASPEAPPAAGEQPEPVGAPGADGQESPPPGTAPAIAAAAWAATQQPTPAAEPKQEPAEPGPADPGGQARRPRTPPPPGARIAPPPPLAGGGRGRRSGLPRVLAVLGLVIVVIAAIVVLVHVLTKSKAAKPAASTGPAVVKVLIPEGKTRLQIAQIAAAAGLRGSYRRASRSTPLLNPRRYGAPAATRDLEGFLFPATYDEYKGAPVEKLVADQLAAFSENFGPALAARARALHITPYEMLIVASMVEREAQVPGDRPKIAAVIYNRLRREMPLGIDATIYYALELEKNTPTYTRELTESQLHINSPYNTRTHVGLPPTPIANPGLASIEAAAHPAHVSYLYYVLAADGCGEHVFSHTLTEFEANAAAST
jgi:cell division protein YceG involved in septum cleavage